MFALNFSLAPAHASTQLATVTISAELTGENAQQLSTKTYTLSEDLSGDFDVGSVALQGGQQLELTYSVGKILADDVILEMSLATSELENMKVELFVEESSTNMLKSFDLIEGNYYTKLSKSEIEIKVVVFVADESMRAQILGNISLSVHELGEDNGGNS